MKYLKSISDNYFYKIHINSVKHIIKNCDNYTLVNYLKLLFENPIDGLGSGDSYFYLCTYDGKYGWMGGNKHGYNWFIEYRYKYGGELLSNKEIRKLKLETIGNVE